MSEERGQEPGSAFVDGRSTLIRGIELFNAGEFWLAHEAWEELWLKETGEERQFLQGLIQLAAAYHHLSRGTSPRGAARLFEAALRRLSPFPEGFRSVMRTSVCATASLHRERIVNGERIEHEEWPKLGYN